MAKITPPQDIPSELYDDFSAIGGVARPNDVAQRRYPWRIIQPGTVPQLEVWDKFLFCVRCFRGQTQEQRQEWYNKSIGSGLFYYNYFMKETLDLLYEGLKPDWCSFLCDVCYEANEMPTEAIPPWTLFGNESWSYASGGILTVLMPPVGEVCDYELLNILSDNEAGNVLEIRMRVVSFPYWSDDHILMSDGTSRVQLIFDQREEIEPPRIRLYEATGHSLNYDINYFNWHTYKLTLKGSSFKCLIDEEVELEIPVGVHLSPNRVRLNLSATIYVSKQIEYDYVRIYRGRI